MVKLAQLYAGPLKDADKALQFAEKARELAPNDPKVIGMLGSVTYQAGNFPWAYSLLQENAHQLTTIPKSSTILLGPPNSFGKVDEARQAMQRVPSTAADSDQSSDSNLFLEMIALTADGAIPSLGNSESSKSSKRSRTTSLR
jgi:hypothetical protein